VEIKCNNIIKKFEKEIEIKLRNYDLEMSKWHSKKLLQYNNHFYDIFEDRLCRNDTILDNYISESTNYISKKIKKK